MFLYHAVLLKPHSITVSPSTGQDKVLREAVLVAQGHVAGQW